MLKFLFWLQVTADNINISLLFDRNKQSPRKFYLQLMNTPCNKQTALPPAVMSAKCDDAPTDHLKAAGLH